MREKQFPEVYTEWESKKDIKIADVEYVTQYENCVNNGDIIGAGAVLNNIKDKVMTTAEWQERYDVCDEIYNYLENKLAEGESIYTGYSCSENYPTEGLKEGYLLFHLNDGALKYTSTISTFTSKTITATTGYYYYTDRINYDMECKPPDSYQIQIYLNGAWQNLPTSHEYIKIPNARTRIIYIYRNKLSDIFPKGTTYKYRIIATVGENTISTEFSLYRKS